MNNVMGLIYTGEKDAQLREMTSTRAVAAVPFAGRYRMIDFPLSNMVESGIRNVGVIMQRNYNSLMDHLGSGREWDLHGKRSGLVLLPPFMTRDNVGVYSGFLDAIRSNLHFLRRSKERYIVVTDSHIIYSAPFDEMVIRHEQSGADTTLLFSRYPGVRRNAEGRYIRMDETGLVTDMEIDPTIPHYENAYLDAFCMRRELLIDLVDRAVAHGQYHLTRDVLLGGIYDKSLVVRGFECPGKVWKIDSVSAYYDCSMSLLDASTRQQLFTPERPVRTKLRDEMPTRHLKNAVVKNSLIADGCVIDGTVENSILFRGVRVEKGAHVKNSIVMQDSAIGAEAELDYCILDKQVTIREGTRLIGPKSYPIVMAKNLIV